MATLHPSKDVSPLTKPSNIHLPVMRLSPDLLGDIFLLAFDGTLNSVRLNVSSVCSYWRAIALDRAALWSMIIVEIKEKLPVQSNMVAWVELCFLRSREALLDVNFLATTAQPGLLELVQAVTALLKPHQQRFRHVYVNLHFSVFARSLIPLTMPLPHLTSLVICKQDWWGIKRMGAARPSPQTRSVCLISQ